MHMVASGLRWQLAVVVACSISAGSFGAIPQGAPSSAVEPLALRRPLIAWWCFDEAFGHDCGDASGNVFDASPASGRGAGLSRLPGVFGGAMGFSGRHMLRVPGKPDFGRLPKISLSAWTLPTGLSAYNEIFRKEDGENRVLFSFQHDGTVLSLGLNINGYVECDAKIDPKDVLDGRWHHCAATFDGQVMRVYLDGKQVGSLERRGTIAAGGNAPGCIGSSNGGECFQGAMDDLRIYKDALTPKEVAQLHQNGVRALARTSGPTSAGEPKIDRPLLAHWTFNDRGGVIHDTSGKAALHIRTKTLMPRTHGVYGHALDLRGKHALKTRGVSKSKAISGITFSVWAKPSDLSGYREIFRQECPQRLLFSFQGSGAILSLGLNVSGYVECDARISAAQLLDGWWHHCAGTFDGEYMRVYLDGKEVGSLKRPGKIAATYAAPSFIGSSGGKSEHFQGALDDLRVYADALPAKEITLLYEHGLKSLEQFTEALEEELASFYAPGKSFAETLASSRRNLVEKGVQLKRNLADAFLRKVRSSFREDYNNFVKWTGMHPVRYLTAKGNAVSASQAERLVALLLEYKPLTQHQWKRQTPQQLAKWKEAEAIEKRLAALRNRGQAACFSPEWVQIILDAGRRIEFRPYVREAVAPYITPSTPKTCSLSAGEAREALERDWLHQADRKPTPQRIKSEIAWTRQLAARIQASFPGEADFASELSRLAELAGRAKSLTAPDAKLYFQVREVKRCIVFKNPVLDFDKVLFVDMPFPQGSEWPHETRHRLGYMAVPGARLLILDGLSPRGKLAQIMPRPPFHGSFWRPDLSYDAKKIVFCFKPHNEKSFHLYEINVDGTGLVQLTDGPYDDFDPIYLPDERHVIFSTTRGHTYVRCMPPTNAYVLARCDRDGKNIYLISSNNEPDYLPSVASDGRIIYTRWEYTDKPLWRAQGSWTANPDGTQVSTFWGNQSVWPDLLKDVRSIPGSRRVMFTGSAHHNWFSGSVGIIDPGKGLNFPHGLTKVTADVTWPECGNGPVDPVESASYHSSGRYAAYYAPYPLSEQDFLVSANRGGKFVLYLMDVDGNRELIYEGVHNIFHALPLRPRPRPTVIPDKVAWPNRKERLEPKGGIIFSNNVYQGTPKALRGKAKFLRVLSIDHKTYTYWHKRPYLSTGPVVSVVQSDGVKRVLGTVPIEADGSVAFHVPTGKALHFQLLDGEYRALQTMRSFTGVMPGERRGCLGCHELHSITPQSDVGSLALGRNPPKITPPPWGQDTVSYLRYVRPVLDKYCGKCHQGDGKGRKKLDLTARPGFLIFEEPYMILTGRPTWGTPYKKPKKPPPGFGIANMIVVEGYDTRDPAAYVTPAPMTHLSYKSKLIEIASSGKHHEVKVDPVSLRKLIAWVDTMCPYRGDEEVRQLPDPVFQGVEWLAVRPRIKTAPRIIRPGPVD